MSYDQFLRFIFPEGMFDYFELSDFKEKSDRVEIYFEEKNIHPQEYATDNLESKGFYEQVRMQDYPMRGRSCLLFIKKRRWFNHSTGKYVSRNWKLVAEGGGVSKLAHLFLCTRPRLSQAGALLLPKNYVSLGIYFYYVKDTFSSLQSQPNSAFSSKN